MTPLSNTLGGLDPGIVWLSVKLSLGSDGWATCWHQAQETKGRSAEHLSSILHLMIERRVDKLECLSQMTYQKAAIHAAGALIKEHHEVQDSTRPQV